MIAKMQKLQIDRGQTAGGGGGLLRLQMYQLHYWPTFTGRVEPILMLLSDAGAGAPPELQTDPLAVRLTPCALQISS